MNQARNRRQSASYPRSSAVPRPWSCWRKFAARWRPQRRSPTSTTSGQFGLLQNLVGIMLPVQFRPSLSQRAVVGQKHHMAFHRRHSAAIELFVTVSQSGSVQLTACRQVGEQYRSRRDS